MFKESKLIEASGKVVVDRSEQRIFVSLRSDILDYYLWFIKKEYWITLQKPMHGAHITIALSKLHNIDWSAASQYNGRKVLFQYDPYLIRGGRTKGFVMFYLKVFSPQIEELKKELDVVENSGYKGLHITVANGKAGVNPYWPELITIV